MIASAPAYPTAISTPSRTVLPPASEPIAPRFTVDGDPRLERHLEQVCHRIGDGLRGLLPASHLEAVALGGGYGRGEGGVCRSAEGDRPYNDLEFYVFLRGSRHLNERLHGRALHVLGEILTPQAGVDVEFRITSLRELARSPVSMFSYDLVCGHRWLIGDDSLLDQCAHHLDAEEIPLGEATRLMMNRCSGLLFAQERLARPVFTPADTDFVARNIAKAQLGAGDAVLTAYAQYHWRVRERHRRLERLARAERTAWLADVCGHHSAGVEFKLHPVRSDASREQLVALHTEVSELCRETWLWLESRRLNRRFASVAAYTDPTVVKQPAISAVRNALVNAKVFGPRALFSTSALRHPRDGVLNAMPVLLWQTDAMSSPSVLARLQRELRADATTFPGLVSAYRDLWSKVN